MGWHENLASSDIPPEHLWDDAEGLDQWWTRVKARHEDESSATSAGDTVTPDEDMTTNELAREFKG